MTRATVEPDAFRSLEEGSSGAISFPPERHVAALGLGLILLGQSCAVTATQLITIGEDAGAIVQNNWPNISYFFKDAEPVTHPVLALLDGWMHDDSGYDESVWPEIAAALEENRPQQRRLFK